MFCKRLLRLYRIAYNMPDSCSCRHEKPRTSIRLFTLEIGAAQSRSVTEIAPKSVLMCELKPYSVLFSRRCKSYLVRRAGGYSQKNWVGVCGPLPKTLTLFMTKICDFPYPIYDLQSSRWRGRQSADGRRGHDKEVASSKKVH